ncbi:hypothetical protein LTR10_023370 [Elasticomyces elasticus]|uniref:Carboxylesterase type B domain-containing protein n=1 Tax=Exophiala sideris TaxID=1016849 RepID=A0ABR0IUI1_9EURO|nr:hypothetical protein LTR10_023370 [Elasticomyces elasticus]KAK5023147.1 hypothetical protein LTR13_011291 [Exophiala sideris]KAK5023369.1 hypothetical protein LTS07_009244 [Exophiala sideris]KAK5048731.1 hypothetical protein LTR69_011322 [Exophiala sideris]KAK5176133.1 hypothetical protein LTR44_011312 [Eurotiomycetes sp. CCFEE 6388]
MLQSRGDTSIQLAWMTGMALPSIAHNSGQSLSFKLSQLSDLYYGYAKRFQRNVDFVLCRPKCPQPYRDIRQFYSLPREQEMPQDIEQNEFECLNLVVSVPEVVLRNRSAMVPVYIFVHGGGHAYTMVNIEQGFTGQLALVFVAACNAKLIAEA